MELNQLRHFLTAARLRNLTLAARELDISQPALSKSIRLLEQQLGATLFERGRFGVRLTHLGHAVLIHSQAIDAQTQSLKTQVEGLKRGYSGLVRIGCGASAATALIPLALTRLAKKRPDIKFAVLHGLNQSLLPWVREGEIDFSLSFAPTFSGDTDLIYEPLYKETGCIVAHASHPLAGARTVGAAKLATCKWVLSQGLPLDRLWFQNIFLSRGISPPDICVETDSTVLMKSLVASGDFVTILPRGLMFSEALNGSLVELKTEVPKWSGSVGITRRRRGILSPASCALIEEIKDVATEGLFQVHKSTSKRRPAKRQST
jgi:DNA-binding transcriptional LysR family regulator